jgi:hypothetical protein
MSLETPEVPAGNGAGPKTRLLSLSDLDKRTQAYRKTVELIAGIERDLGGSDRLSVQERTIVQRAGLLATIAASEEARFLAGEPIDVVVLCTVNNSLKRLLEAVGLKRQSRPINEIDQHLLAALKEEYDADGS